jgi:hypothetical protein
MSSTQVIGKTANETPRTRTVEMKLEVVVIPVSDVRNGARGAMVRLALAAALVPASNFPARAQNCPPGYKIAAGACVQVCPGGYEDTGRVCVYRRQGGGNGS